MAKDMNNVVSSVENSAQNIQNLSFTDFWSGDASRNQTNLLSGIVNRIRSLGTSLETFKTNIANLDKYKELLKVIEAKENSLGSMERYLTYKGPDGKEYQQENPEYIKLLIEINQLKQKAVNEKNKLQSYFNGIIPIIGQRTPQVVYKDPNYYNNQEIDLTVSQFFSNLPHLRIIGGSDIPTKSGGLYDVYASQGGRDYVRKRLMDAINKAGGSNRQKSVNAVLELFNMTTAAGIKLPYINKGAGSDGSFVTTDCVATGVDCNAFVSWAVDKGVTNGFQWRPCSGPNGLTEVGKNIPYENWQLGKPGDVFSRGVNGYHSAYLLRNYPESKMVVIAQASGQIQGITLTRTSYDNLRADGMVLRNMDDVYSGVDQASRYNIYQLKGQAKYSEINTDLRTVNV